MDLKVLRSSELEALACVVVGTRPGIVKQSPVIRALHDRGIPHFVLHTGQHYSHEMDQAFFEDLDLPQPDYRVDVPEGSRLHGEQTAAMLVGTERILIERRPKIVLVGGDANTNLAAALAARKLRIGVGHVEAGLRSFDWSMPEEHNRRMIDHISDHVFAPTENARRNLEREAVTAEIHVVGNTIVDAALQHAAIALLRSSVLDSVGVAEGRYVLATVHREENTDDVERLVGVVDGLAAIAREFAFPVVVPLHPRTRARLDHFGLLEQLESSDGVITIRAAGYLDFLRLVAASALVVTDSGGVQQEACILNVPCLTLRNNTEWVETLAIGSNMLTPLETGSVVSAAGTMLSADRGWVQPFGDGRAGERIADVVDRFLGRPLEVVPS